MRRFSHLIERYLNDHMHSDSKMYRAMRFIDEGDLDAAKDEILNAMNYNERNQAVFDEVATFVGVLLEELRDVDEEASILPRGDMDIIMRQTILFSLGIDLSDSHDADANIDQDTDDQIPF